MAETLTIITGAGGELGTGHVQRMMSLADYLLSDHGTEAKLSVNNESLPFIPSHLAKLIWNNSPASDLIMRDKRDSDRETVNELKRHGKLIVIDDVGEGRSHADMAIDLLPNLSYEYKFGTFIYGYNFRKSLDNLDKVISKDIDIAVYLGNTPDSGLSEILSGLLNRKFRYVLIKGHGNFESNIPSLSASGFSEILCRSRFFITYFGISLFEACLCRCRIITLNPTAYHFKLAESVMNYLPVINNMSFSDVSPQTLPDIFKNIPDDEFSLSVDTSEIRDRIYSNLFEFSRSLNLI